MAQGLIDLSGGQIRVGVYHSDVKDAQKERLHVRWRSGEIKVVCATIGTAITPAYDVNVMVIHVILQRLVWALTRYICICNMFCDRAEYS